jgi:Planctomycete cytochrome C
MANQKKIKVVVTTAALFIFLAGLILNSCKHANYVLPEAARTGDPNICFERDVQPIFTSNCAKSGCHDEGSHKGGYLLNNYQNIVSRGIIPGNPAASIIWQSIGVKVFGVTHMPEGSPSLSSDQLSVIRRWIATGAIDSGACNTVICDTNNFTYSGAIAPLIQLNCVGCHNTSSSAGGSLADYNSVYQAAVNGSLVGTISHLPGYNPMPQGAPMLSDCQITQVKKWVAAGAPNN